MTRVFLLFEKQIGHGLLPALHTLEVYLLKAVQPF